MVHMAARERRCADGRKSCSHDDGRRELDGRARANEIWAQQDEVREEQLPKTTAEQAEIKRAEFEASISFLEWSIEARHTIQAQSLDLLRLMNAYGPEATSNQKRNMRRLIGVAFALWRGAFLADRKAKLKPSFIASQAFLKKVLDDNTVTFSFDFQNRDWTFRFYADAAYFNFAKLPEELRPKIKPFKSSTQEWDNLLEGFEYSVKELTAALKNDHKKLKKKKL